MSVWASFSIRGIRRLESVTEGLVGGGQKLETGNCTRSFKPEDTGELEIDATGLKLVLNHLQIELECL